MEEGSSEEEDESSTPMSAGSGKKALAAPMPPREVQQPPPLPPTPDKVVVKKGYDPKQGAAKMLASLLHSCHCSDLYLLLDIIFITASILVCSYSQSLFFSACVPALSVPVCSRYYWYTINLSHWLCRPLCAIVSTFP
jgi:hypothetical protein